MRAPTPCGHAAGSWYTAGVKNVKIDGIVQPSVTMMAAEAWRNHDFADWDEPYFNPNHKDRNQYVRIDGGVASVGDTGDSGPGCLWCTPSISTDSELHYWAAYLSPHY